MSLQQLTAEYRLILMKLSFNWANLSIPEIWYTCKPTVIFLENNHPSPENYAESPMSWEIDTSGFDKPKKKNVGIPVPTSKIPAVKKTKSKNAAGRSI